MARPGDSGGGGRVRQPGLGRRVLRHGGQFQAPPMARQGGQAQGQGQLDQSGDPYDYSSDPILQRTKAIGQRTIAEAEADALRQRRQLALDYGDESEARALGLSEADIAAARDNPFSVRAKQSKAAKEQPLALTENLNKGNLFYSSEFGKQQGNLAMSLLEQQANAGREFHNQESGIEQGLLGARRGVEEANWTAEQQAADRRQQQVGSLPYGHQQGQVPVVQPHLSAALVRTRRPRPSRYVRPAIGGHQPEGP